MDQRKSVELRELASHVHADLNGPEELLITGLNTLEDAVKGDLTFIGSNQHGRLWANSLATAAVVDRGIEVPGHTPADRALLFVDDADLAMAEILGLFKGTPDRPKPGIAPTAIIDDTATIHPTAIILAGCTVGARTVIGENTFLEYNVHIGEDCKIGSDCHLRSGVIIRETCILGDRVGLHSNAVIGSDGFGYRPDGKGGLTKIPHIGTVILENDVEVGASSAIDRGKFGATVIGAHTKIDNLVQIGHNVKIGRGCVLAGQVGVAGSTVIGDYCQFGGKSGIADHVRIGSQVKLAGHSAIWRDTPDGATMAGLPAMDMKEYWRIYRIWTKLPDIHKAVRKLTKGVGGGKSRESS